MRESAKDAVATVLLIVFVTVLVVGWSDTAGEWRGDLAPRATTTTTAPVRDGGWVWNEDGYWVCASSATGCMSDLPDNGRPIRIPDLTEETPDAG